ncbi:MAG: DUF2059 domain-containing protein [Acidobacteriota bacterium]|nr:DUF2059 domain-containing protein [Acidobacteriota bacterium]
MNWKAARVLSAQVIILCCLARSQGQEPETNLQPDAAPKQEVSAEKRTLIKQILDETNSQQNADAMFSAQFDATIKQLPEVQWQTISSSAEFKRLRPAQQEEVREKFDENIARVSKRIKELFLQRIDMKQMVEDISYSVYDKHFTETELKDLVAFYGSPTGKKVIAEMPALFAESIAKAGEIIGPRVKGIIDEIQREQTNELSKQIDVLLKSAPKPLPKKRTPVRRRP